MRTEEEEGDERFIYTYPPEIEIRHLFFEIQNFLAESEVFLRLNRSVPFVAEDIVENNKDAIADIMWVDVLQWQLIALLEKEEQERFPHKNGIGAGSMADNLETLRRRQDQIIDVMAANDWYRQIIGPSAVIPTQTLKVKVRRPQERVYASTIPADQRFD